MSTEQIVSSHGAEAHASLVAVTRELLRLEGGLRDLENEMRESLEHVAPDRRESATNLVHYVALRQHDLRDLQVQLSQRGLSSLGRSESCVMSSLLEVLERAHESLALRGHAGAKQEWTRLEKKRSAAMSWETAKYYLHQHTRDVLGPRPEDRHIYIMVTAPSALEADRAWMVKMLNAGMNVLRVNCAHEGEHEWGQMLLALAEARRETGKECRVLMDLAGPKIRTGPIAGARHIATWKPTRDEIGNPTAPARVVIRRASAMPVDGAGPFLFVCDESFAKMRKGDELRFRDARGKKRAMAIHAIERDEIVAFSTERTYVLEKARAHLERAGALVADLTIEVGGAEHAAIDAREGDTLLLTGRAVEGMPPRRDREGRVVKPGVIACTLPGALDHLELGQRVLFDDGRIHAVVERVRRKRVDFLLHVVRTQKQITRLGAEKGINLPDTLITEYPA